MARRSDHTREELREMALAAARKNTAEKGLRGLKARQIARDIGYTIGTFYNLFEDFDDLIVHMNGETLDALFASCVEVRMVGNPVTDLQALAERYMHFTGSNPKLWNAIFEHKLPDDRVLPEWFAEKVDKLIALEENALAPIFPDGPPEEIRHHAQVLWTSLFGIVMVESSGRLPQSETMQLLVQSLIKTYVNGLTVAG